MFINAHKLHVAIKVTKELLYDNAFNLESHINDLQDYIKKQRTDLAEFDEALVKRWLKQITVWDDHFTVELKSGVSIDIHA